MYALLQGFGNIFNSKGCVNCGISLAGRKKIITFILKFFLYGPENIRKENYEGRERLLLT